MKVDLERLAYGKTEWRGQRGVSHQSVRHKVALLSSPSRLVPKPIVALLLHCADHGQNLIECSLACERAGERPRRRQRFRCHVEDGAC